MAIYRGAGGSGDATTDAANQASVATAKAAEATTSANAAASSATSADNSATASSTSASNSATSATASASSATASASSATAAASSATAAAASYDDFDDRYLGAKSSDPTVDNDGGALTTGALYFNTTTEVMMTYTGSAWQTITTGSGGLQAANNLNDVASASTSRTNLGLAIGSDVQAHSAVLDATTASYTTAEETKLAGIETAADVTDGTNVTAAGALMDSEVTNLAQVKAFDSTDYATAAQGTLADSAIQTGDSPSFAGLTTTDNINFGDNDKAVFGAGSDLQIYHDSGNSYIAEGGSGTGSLKIKANNLLAYNNSDVPYFQGITGGTFRIYHNGSNKLATTSTGVDVTGTVVSDGLTVDTDKLVVDSSGNVGIGTSSPANSLETAGAIVAQGAATAYTNTGLYLQYKGSSVVDVGAWRSGASVAELSFSTDSGSDASPVERMRIDSSGNVGVGTTNPTATIDVSGNARGAVVTDNDLSFDLSAGNNFSCTPTGGGTLTFTNHLAGQSGFIWLDNSGGHAIAAAGTTKINAADLTAISTAGVYTLSYFDNGTNAYVSVSRSFA